MYACEHCGKEHDGTYGSRRFCNETCARAFSTAKKREAINRQVSSTLKARELTDEEKEARRLIIARIPKEALQRGFEISLKTRNENAAQRLQDWYDGKVVLSRRNLGAIKKFLRKIKDCCWKCGWAEKHPVTGLIPVELHHENGDPHDNQQENLSLLCPNCHSLTTTYRALNKGNGREDRYEKKT
jgi:hypothetical protein